MAVDDGAHVSGAFGVGPDDIVARGHASWTVVDDEVVVVEPLESTPYLLDRTAAVLWRCLDETSTFGEVVTDIAEAFDVPVERVAADCRPVVSQWLHVGLASRVVGSAAAAPATGSAVPLGRTWRRLVDPPNT